MRSVIKAILASAVVYPSSSHARVVVEHILPAQGGIRYEQSLGGCVSATTNDRDCSPSQLSADGLQKLSAGAVIKSKRKGIEAARSLLFEKTTKNSLDELFKDFNFLSYSIRAKIEARFDQYSIWYVPLHGVAVALVSNPSLPELSASVSEQEILGGSFGKGLDLENIPFVSRLHYGIDFYRYSRKMIDIDANAIEFAIQDLNEIVEEKTEDGFDVDLGVTAEFPWKYAPRTAVVVRNAFSTYRPYYSQLDIDYLFYRRVLTSVTWDFPSSYGEFSSTLSGTFRGKDLKHSEENFSVSGMYRIGSLEAHISASQITRGFGFLFKHSLYNLGIRYANEKQDNRVKIGRENSVVIHAEIEL